MHMLKLSESTAARRRILVRLVDETDGVTPETGITASAGDIKISKNGAADANHGGTFTEIALGDYYYEFTAGELDTVGFIRFNFTQAGVMTFVKEVQVISFDPYDAAGLGLSRVDATIGSRATQTSVDTIDNLLDTEVAEIITNQATIITALGVIDDFLDTEIAAIKAKTDQLTFTTANRVDASILGLTAGAVDSIWDASPAAELSVIPNTVATFKQMFQFMYQYFKLKRTVGSGTETMYKDDSANPLGTSTYSDDGTTFTKGKLS